MCLVRDYRPGLLLREENNNIQTLNTNKAVVKNDILTTLSKENMALARPSCVDSDTISVKETLTAKTPSQEVSASLKCLSNFAECLVTHSVCPN